MEMLKESWKMLLFFLIWMLIGPIKISGTSLENRYHDMVNSQSFKDNYRNTLWLAARPLTWTGEKITGLFNDTKEAVQDKTAQGR